MAQLEKPTPKDWVSQVLDDLKELEISFELEQIEVINKEKLKTAVKEAVQNKAFSFLMAIKDNRKSENAKGRLIQYHSFEMAEYLCPTDEDVSIKERKYLIKYRVDDLNVKGNQSWKYQDSSCLSCKNKENKAQSHIYFVKH